MDRISLKEYMKLPLSDRKAHIDLSQDCLEIGAASINNRALLAVHLNTTCEPLGKREGCLCHACYNGGCSNVNHLYWGTAGENTSDRFKEDPTLILRIKQTTLERYGEDFYKKVGSLGKTGWKTEKPSSTLSELEKARRLKLLAESGIDIYVYGWVAKVAKLWGISHTRVKSFFDNYWEGPKPYGRGSKTC